ncbi:MAG: START domain-containing protein [Cellvibrionaceae bacterium]
MQPPFISNRICTLFFILVCSLPLTVQAQVDDSWRSYSWKEKKDKDGIKIYTSKVADSKFDAVYGSMLVQASVNSLVALVKDTDSCSQWADLCKESRVEKKNSEVEYFVYTYNDVPFPVTDRDVIAKVNWSQDPDTLAVIMTAEPTPDMLKETNAVRIIEADSRWYFTPQADGSTKVETFAHINPNGPTPAWLINMLLVSSPFKTMQGMKKMMESGIYDNADSIF